MRVLTISDRIEPILYSPYIKARLGEIGLVLSCGDLPFYYIEFISSMLGAPCYYVFGNHAQGMELGLDPPARRFVGGNIDGRLVYDQAVLSTVLQGV